MNFAKSQPVKNHPQTHLQVLHGLGVVVAVALTVVDGGRRCHGLGGPPAPTTPPRREEVVPTGLFEIPAPAEERPLVRRPGPLPPAGGEQGGAASRVGAAAATAPAHGGHGVVGVAGDRNAIWKMKHAIEREKNGKWKRSFYPSRLQQRLQLGYTEMCMENASLLSRIFNPHHSFADS